MAFVRKNFAPGATSSAQNAPVMHFYNSGADALATVAGSDYFSGDAAGNGLYGQVKLGDHILVALADGSASMIYRVSTVTAATKAIAITAAFDLPD